MDGRYLKLFVGKTVKIAGSDGGNSSFFYTGKLIDVDDNCTFLEDKNGMKVIILNAGIIRIEERCLNDVKRSK